MKVSHTLEDKQKGLDKKKHDVNSGIQTVHEIDLKLAAGGMLSCTVKNSYRFTPNTHIHV